MIPFERLSEPFPLSTMSLNQEASNKVCGGTLTKYSFPSKALGGLKANINVFLPEQASESKKVPVIYYLAGLTCNEDTGAQKGAFFHAAAKHGVALVFPDTSPRGAEIEGEDKDWDFGTGAGFYINATSAAYKKHYNMYDHVLNEIPAQLGDLNIDVKRASIMGHSMGGHGALSLALKNPGHFKSASGFAPIANPTQCPWGNKAFEGYLDGGSSEGAEYDSTLLIAKYPSDQPLAIKVDYGTSDQFYKDGQLRPEAFQEAVKKAGREKDVTIDARDGYDHS